MSAINATLEDRKTQSLFEEQKHAAAHPVDLKKLPKMMDMSATSITENVHAVNNANCSDERTKFIFQHLVQHLHDFVRETNLTTEEWLTAIKFLTETGKKSSDFGQQFMLLSDALGVTTLVDSLNNGKPTEATQPTVLGPFFIDDAHDVENGDSIASEGKGDYLYVHGRVIDLKGNPISDAIIDTWEADGFGLYDNQYTEKGEADCRGRLRSDADGKYAFRAVVPKSYPIPLHGPAGVMFKTLGRHPFRPAHIHLQIQAAGYEKLITQLYLKGDPYLTSDAIFGVKSSLIVDLKPINDPELSAKRGFGNPDKMHMEIEQDIVLATPTEAEAARKKLRGGMTKSVKTGANPVE